MFNRKCLCLIFCNHSFLFIEIWFASDHEWRNWICIVFLWLTFKKTIEVKSRNSATLSILIINFLYITRYFLLSIFTYEFVHPMWKILEWLSVRNIETKYHSHCFTQKHFSKRLKSTFSGSIPSKSYASLLIEPISEIKKSF